MQAPVPMSGKLDENGLPRILNYLREIKAAGTLAVSSVGVTKKLFLKNGGIIFASSTYEGDRLGEILLKSGKISVKQFETASKVVIETGKRLGGVLVELGYLTPKDLFWGVKFQVQEIVCSLFEWTDGDYGFIPGELPSTEVITLHMSTPNLIIQGVKRIDDWTRISRGIPPMDTVLRLTTNPMKLYQDVDITPEERKVISLFDGVRKIRDVFDHAKIGDFDALKAVYVFTSIGMLEEVGPKESEKKAAAAPPPPKEAPVKAIDKTSIHKAYIDSMSQNHYELLKLESDASGDQIKAAYQELAKLYHPDLQYREGMGPLKDELEELFNRLTEAHEILSDDSRRWEYDLSLATVMGGPTAAKAKKAKDPAKAQEAFAKGIESFKTRDFESATVHFKEAARLDATKGTYLSHLALALLQRPRREAEAEEAMLEAIELEPENADHRANLGLLYQKANIKDKAKQAFQEALRLDPKNAKALKGLGKK